MSDRDKKLIKLLSVLGPLLLLCLWYGYSQIRATQKRRAERAERAKKQSEEATTGESQVQAADPGTKAQPSPPPGVQSANNPAIVPTAAYQGIRMTVNNRAQAAREKLPWGRDPFTPPDTEGPRIGKLADLESPRGKKKLVVRVLISDRAAGNSGVRGATLRYGVDEPYDRRKAKGRRPQSRNGDGTWEFTLPAPAEQPWGCFVVATDAGRLRSQNRSPVFKVTPPPRETVETQIGGTGVKLTLRGISWAGKTGVALINNDVFSEGEYVQGYEVKKIVKNGVVLNRNGQEVFLQLKE